MTDIGLPTTRRRTLIVGGLTLAAAAGYSGWLFGRIRQRRRLTERFHQRVTAAAQAHRTRFHGELDSVYSPLDQYIESVALPGVEPFLAEITGVIDSLGVAKDALLDYVNVGDRRDRLRQRIEAGLDRHMKFPAQLDEAVGRCAQRFTEIQRRLDEAFIEEVAQAAVECRVALPRAELAAIVEQINQQAAAKLAEQIDGAAEIAGAAPAATGPVIAAVTHRMVMRSIRLAISKTGGAVGGGAFGSGGGVAGAALGMVAGAMVDYILGATFASNAPREMAEGIRQMRHDLRAMLDERFVAFVADVERRRIERLTG